LDVTARRGLRHAHQGLTSAQAVEEEPPQIVPLSFEDHGRLRKAPKFAHLFAAAVDNAKLVQLPLGGGQVQAEFDVEILLRSGLQRGGRLVGVGLIELGNRRDLPRG
jgi:hypothetical protein